MATIIQNQFTKLYFQKDDRPSRVRSPGNCVPRRTKRRDLRAIFQACYYHFAVGSPPCQCGRRLGSRRQDRSRRGRCPLQPSALAAGPSLPKSTAGSGMERTETGDPVAEKTRQDALGIPFSKGEAVLVSDGRDAWFFVPGDRQARKTAARKLEDVRSPLAFLLGKTKLEKELQGLSLAPDVEPLLRREMWCCGVCRRRWPIR